ncbi:MAG: sodium transporter [Planctomycetia bacterium]|nr:sodium transporter [Planctomycetia bacterium]
MTAWILIILFIFVMLGIGVWGMQKTKTLGDYFLGGRTLGPWMSAFAYSTSYFSAVMFIGFAGKLGWAFGIHVLWISLGNVLFGALLAWFVLGYRTRRMSQNLEVMTMPEFFEARLQAPGIKIFSAIIIFLFLLPYSASVFQGLGYLFEVSFGMNYPTAILIMCVVTAIYLILGGYFAVALNDFIQGMVMILGTLLMVSILTGKAGGLTETVQAIQVNYAQHIPKMNWILLSATVFMTSFGVWGLPQMVQKFYAIHDEKQIARAAIITTCFSFIIVFSAYFVGSMSHLFYDPPTRESAEKDILAAKDSAQAKILSEEKKTAWNTREKTLHSVPAPAIIRGEHVVPDFDKFVPDILYNTLPEIFMTIIVLLVLSASMSTLSSLVLVSSSSIAIDLYQGIRRGDESSGNSLVLIRFLSGLFILISFFIALSKFEVIVTLMSLSWGSVTGVFMAPYLLALYWKGITRVGTWAGMISGLVTNTLLFFILGPQNAPIAASAAMIVPFFIIPLVSFWTKPPEKAVLQLAFTGNKNNNE